MSLRPIEAESQDSKKLKKPKIQKAKSSEVQVVENQEAKNPIVNAYFVVQPQLAEEKRYPSSVYEDVKPTQKTIFNYVGNTSRYFN